MAARVARPATISGPLVRSHMDHASKTCLQIEESLAQWLSGLTVRDRPAEAPCLREEQKGNTGQLSVSTRKDIPEQKSTSSTGLPCSPLVVAHVGQVVSRSDVDVAAATENAASHGDGAGESQEERKPGPSDRRLLHKARPVIGALRDIGAPPNGKSSSGSDSDGSSGGGEDPREPTSSDGAILATVFRPLPQVHQFSPFHPAPRAGGYTNREVARRLRRPLTGTDLARKKEKTAMVAAGGGGQGSSSSDLRGGFVYVFTLPDAVAVCPPTRHVKIGMTTQRAVAARLAQIRARCGYAPVLVAAAWTRHPLRVEELAHAQLGERRRLQLGGGGGCPGCGSRHREWFETGAAEAAEVVRVWASWVERRTPYDDETGELREEWRRRLPETLPEDPAFWKPFTGVNVPGAAWQGGDVQMSG
ncbi:hypothetical protein RB595_001462 [Gaeumannomyces hyphopodioides]